MENMAPTSLSGLVETGMISSASPVDKLQLQSSQTDLPRVRLQVRPYCVATVEKLQQRGVHPLLARLWAARGMTQNSAIELDWANLLPPGDLSQAEYAAELLANAIAQNKKLLIVGDYDCDGATATAVGLLGLRQLIQAVQAVIPSQAKVDFLVPNRFETGYGLSPAVVDLALQHPHLGKPDLLITVDNGIASVEGVAAANDHGIGVIITDHHLPGETLPQALAIVNPNQANCQFSSKNLAGVGVMFYLLLALRSVLRSRGWLAASSQPAQRLDHLLDLVALGTVADVVKLDSNNRLLVAQGLKRIRQGNLQVGIAALFAVAGRDSRNASASDLGFMIGPRLNAAGRLADMSLGVQCLTTHDPGQALTLARELDTINRERRDIEGEMREHALLTLAESDPHNSQHRASVCAYHDSWHQGVVGLLAARLKERYWCPAIAFAPGTQQVLNLQGLASTEIKGSGRSVPEVHLRDVLDLVSKRKPGLIKKFGGHAMAAGLSIAASDIDIFKQAFDQAVVELSGRTAFEAVLETDGSLEPSYIQPDIVKLLDQQVWGSGFAAPLFQDEFRVLKQRIVGEHHLKLQLERHNQVFEGIWFSHSEPLPQYIIAAYRIGLNEFQGRISVQLILEYAQGVD